MKKENNVRLPSLVEAWIPILTMAGLMLYCLNVDGVYVDAHMPLVVSMCVACVIGVLCGHSFSSILSGMIA